MRRCTGRNRGIHTCPEEDNKRRADKSGGFITPRTGIWWGVGGRAQPAGKGEDEGKTRIGAVIVHPGKQDRVHPLELSLTNSVVELVRLWFDRYKRPARVTAYSGIFACYGP